MTTPQASAAVTRALWRHRNSTRPSSKILHLRQDHFANGTVVVTSRGITWTNPTTKATEFVHIDTSGFQLVLTEDVVFNPNAAGPGAMDPDVVARSGMPTSEQLQRFYDPKAFGVGFFAAIALACENVSLDLNGHAIQQGAEHYLHQRFYSNIEMAGAPFILGQGPHDFGTHLSPAVDVEVHNGRLGQASHHGLHGNNNERIWIHNLTFEDFEVCALSLNGPRQACLEDLDIRNNSRKVPVLGTFSTAVFLLPFVAALEALHGGTRSVTIQGQVMSAAELGSKLRLAVAETHHAVLSMHRPELVPSEFRNPFDGLLDGTVYGMVINGQGVAVNDFPSTPGRRPAETVYLGRVKVRGLASAPSEVPALAVPGTVLPETDPVGSVLRIDDLWTAGGGYAGSSILGNCKLLVAAHTAALPEPLRTRALRGTISADTLRTAADPSKTFSGRVVLFNGDSMHHVNKGVIGVRLDCVMGGCVEDVLIEDIENRATRFSLGYRDLRASGLEAALEPADLARHRVYERRLGPSNSFASSSHGSGTQECTGLEISSSQNCVLRRLNVRGVLAQRGRAIGVRIQHQCVNLVFSGSLVGFVHGGTNATLQEFGNHPANTSGSFGILSWCPNAIAGSMPHVKGPIKALALEEETQGTPMSMVASGITGAASSSMKTPKYARGGATSSSCFRRPPACR